MRAALVVLVLAACDDRLLSPPSAQVDVVEVAVFPATPSRKLDVLFQIDDSGGTAHLHDSLARALPAFLQAVTIDGRLPNLHLGVTTSDLGTSGSLDPANPATGIGTLGNGGCAGQGKDGALLIGTAPVTGSFIVDVDDGAGGRIRNYGSQLVEVVGNMLRRGSTGCGFEQPLAATRRALSSPANAGFVRPDAKLAVVILADEDDCSVRDAGAFFDRSEASLGPLTSFRCTAQGVQCDEPLDVIGPKTACRSRVDSPYIEDIALTSTLLDTLKGRSATVSAIVGPAAPFEVEHRAVGSESQLGLAHACPGGGGSVAADPALRIAELVRSCGGRGALLSVCHDDLTPQAAQIGTLAKQSLGVACLETSKLADALADPGVQPTCEANDVLAGGTRVALPACPAEGDCWKLRVDPLACPETSEHTRILVDRTSSPAADTYVEVRCEVPSNP